MEHPLLLAICTFMLVLVAISGAAYRLVYRRGRLLRQLGTPVIAEAVGRRSVETPVEANGSAVLTVLHQLGSRMPSSDADLAALRGQLIRGGFRSDNASPIFYGMRLVATAVMLAGALLLEGQLPPNPPMRMAFIGISLASGWILPRFLLEKKVAKRQETLRLSLADALDLLVVAVEAGLGLDQAMQYVAKELQWSHPVLSEELSLVQLEMRAGKRRADALRNLAERTGEPELKKLVAILIQNDRFGTSMGDSLRNHSDFLRTKRRQDAEERAGKVGVKLVFPIFFFVLPSMLIVAVGPGVLQIFTQLLPMMDNLGKAH
ncbi:MAG TPA: type II secretion system F family protein [Bryobacteraceae bacterium]|nr:type II secretion system F family protein [Bryobacteraceae bacterium]